MINRKKILSLLISAVSAVGIVTSSGSFNMPVRYAAAAEMSEDYAGYYTTKGVKDWLNLREQPNTSSKIVSRIYPNDKIEVLASDGKWAYVDYYGTKGYASMDYLEKKISIIRPQKETIGDVNKDGNMDIADAVFVQKWLNHDKSAVLSDWKQADLNNDGKLNVFDLCLMKKLLVNVNESHELIDGLYYLDGIVDPKPSRSVFRMELSTSNDQIFIFVTEQYPDSSYINYSTIANFNIENNEFRSTVELYNDKLEFTGNGDTVTVKHHPNYGNDYTEIYNRSEEETASVSKLENELDPNSPNGAIEKNISYAAKAELGFANDHVLTEAECKKILNLTFSGAASLDGIEYFTELQYISMSECDITDITPLTQLKKLQHIDSLFCMINEIPDFSDLTDLSYLWLNYAAISDLTPVTNIKNLKGLQLVSNRIKTIAPIKEMNKLEYLDISYNPITDWEIIKDNTALVKSLTFDYSHCCKALEKAKQIVAETVDDSMTDLEKQVRLSQWVLDNIDYNNKIVDTPDTDYPTYMALIDNNAICRHYADAVSLLMNLAGLDVVTCVNPYVHSWNMINLNGEWYEFDCTYMDNAYRPEEWNFFNRSRTFTNAQDSDHKLQNVYEYPIAEKNMGMSEYMKYVRFYN